MCFERPRMKILAFWTSKKWHVAHQHVEVVLVVLDHGMEWDLHLFDETIITDGLVELHMAMIFESLTCWHAFILLQHIVF